jgi:purine-binding chemotaxis protein CheW
MTLPNSASNNGPPQHPKTALSVIEEAEIQNEASLSPAELAEIWARRAYALAEEPPAEVTGQTVDLLVFWLGGERYGMDVTNVREIYPMEQMTPVPRAPDFVTGVFSARGRILSIVDLRAFFSQSPSLVNGTGQEGVAQSKIIVVANTNPASETVQMELGVLADEVADVMTVFKDDLEPPLTTQAGIRVDYVTGLTADMMTVLNLNALLSDKRMIVYEEIM